MDPPHQWVYQSYSTSTEAPLVPPHPWEVLSRSAPAVQASFRSWPHHHCFVRCCKRHARSFFSFVASRCRQRTVHGCCYLFPYAHCVRGGCRDASFLQLVGYDLLYLWHEHVHDARHDVRLRFFSPYQKRPLRAPAAAARARAGRTARCGRRPAARGACRHPGPATSVTS